MTVALSLPRERAGALSWVAAFVFGEVLDVKVRIVPTDANQVLLEMDGKQLALASEFPPGDDVWPTRKDMPRQPLAVWRGAILPELKIRDLPILFGAPGLKSSSDGNRVECNVDVLGSIFFMLSRFEEIATGERDRHDRFPASASLALKESFLLRPIVDELIELLWASMARLWPTLKRRVSEGRMRISCDVDKPFDQVGRSASRLVFAVARDALLLRKPRRATFRTINFFLSRRRNLKFDPYYNFDWYMDTCEHAGHRVTFHFICGHSGGSLDGTYNIYEPRIISLIRRIHERGHEVNLHASYNTFRDPVQLGVELLALQSAMRTASIEESPKGNRQHYLRWDAACTPDHLQDIGVEIDSSGGFADHIGFRFGTSREFPMWSWKKHVALSLRQRPLIAMDTSIFDAKYMQVATKQDALQLVLEMRDVSTRYGGDFNLLWHNDDLFGIAERRLFVDILSSKRP